MSKKVRRLGLVSLAILGGTTLLLSSIALVEPGSTDTPNLNFTLSDSGVASSTGSVWIMDPVRSPEGIRGLAVSVAIGRERPRTILTNASTVVELLGALGVRLARGDLVRPSRTALLEPGMLLRIVRTSRTVQTVVEDIPFQTLIQYSSRMPVGETVTVTPGTAGQAIRSFQVTSRNGAVVSRELLSEVIVFDPAPRVILEGTRMEGAPAPPPSVRYGQASWYHCSGMYAASRDLPFGTVVTVANLDNGQAVTVVINDRGPWGIRGRIIDLCATAFAELAPLGQGLADVTLTW